MKNFRQKKEKEKAKKEKGKERVAEGAQEVDAERTMGSFRQRFRGFLGRSKDSLAVAATDGAETRASFESRISSKSLLGAEERNEADKRSISEAGTNSNIFTTTAVGSDTLAVNLTQLSTPPPLPPHSLSSLPLVSASPPTSQPTSTSLPDTLPSSSPLSSDPLAAIPSVSPPSSASPACLAPPPNVSPPSPTTIQSQHGQEASEQDTKETSPRSHETEAKLLDSIRLMMDELQGARASLAAKKWTYLRQGNTIEAAARISRILQSFEIYAKIIDVGIQHSPEVTALVWGAARAILRIAQNAVEFIETLEVTLAVVVDKMATCEFYTRIYKETFAGRVLLSSQATTHIFTKRIDTALTEFYGAILDFVKMAKEYFESCEVNRLMQLKYFLKPFPLKSLVDDIEEKEKNVKECAEMATMQRVMDIETSIQNIRSQMAPLITLDDELFRLANENLNIGKESVILGKQNMDLANTAVALGQDTLAAVSEVKHIFGGLPIQVVSLIEQHQKKILFQGTSLDSELRELKDKYIKDSQESDGFEIDQYVTTKGMNTPYDPEEEHFDLFECAKEILSGGSIKKVCLIQGAAGSGKSTFLHFLARQLWNEYDKCPLEGRGNIAIPLFISLPTTYSSGTQSEDLIASFFQKRGWKAEWILYARRELNFVFILDGFDEINTESKGNFYINNRIQDWHGKTVITSRPEYLPHGYQSLLDPSKEQRLLQEYWIAPFNADSIKQYISQYINISKTDIHIKYFDDLMSQPDIGALISNPFLLRMVVTVQPTLQQKLNRVNLYAAFISEWVQQSQARWNIIQLGKEFRGAFDSLCMEYESLGGFAACVREFCREFALELYRHGILEATYEPLHPRSRFSNRQTHASPSPSPWEIYLGADNKLRLIRFSSPLLRRQNSYRFLHKSLRDYLIAEVLWCDIETNFQPDRALINQFTIVHDYGIIDFVVEYAKTHTLFQEKLLTYVEASKENNKVATAAANALTILVRAGRKFGKHDFRRICVAGADLSGGWFEQAQMQGTDLRNVHLRGAWLRGANLSEANMENVWFGEKPTFVLGEAYDYPRACVTSQSGDVLLATTTPDWHIESTPRQGHDLKLWSVPQRRLLHEFRDSWDTLPVAFSSCGTMLSYCTLEGISVWSIGDDISFLQKFKVISLASRRISCVVFSFHNDETHCHRLLAAGMSDGSIIVWPIGDPNGSETVIPDSTSNDLLIFSPDGQWLASSRSGLILLWSLRKNDFSCGQQYHGSPVLIGHHQGIASFAFSPRDGLLASGSRYGHVKIWSIHTRELLHKLDLELASVSRPWDLEIDLQFVANGQLLTLFMYGIISIWTIPKFTLYAKFTLYTRTNSLIWPSHLRFENDPNIEECNAVMNIRQHGQLFRVTVATNDIRQFDIPLHQGLRAQTRYSIEVQEHHKLVGHGVCIAVSLDGRSLAYLTDRGILLRCSDEFGTQIIHLNEMVSNADGFHLQFSPTSTTLIGVSDYWTPESPGKLLFWSDQKASPKVYEIYAYNDRSKGNISSVAFSPTGQLFAIGNDKSRLISIWSMPDLNDNRLLCADLVYLSKSHRGSRNLVFSPDGMLLASIVIGCGICLWSVADTRTVFKVIPDTIGINEFAFSASGALIAGLEGHASGINVWSLSGLAQQTPFDWELCYWRGVCFLFSDTVVAAGSYTHCVVRLWSLDFQSLLAYFGVPLAALECRSLKPVPGDHYQDIITILVNCTAQCYRITKVPIDSNGSQFSLEITCQWSFLHDSLWLNELRIHRVTGLDEENLALLKQQGAIIEDVDSAPQSVIE